VAKCGHSFSRNEIKNWLQNRNVCPFCETKLTNRDLFDNFALKSIVEQFSSMKEKMDKFFVECIKNQKSIKEKLKNQRINSEKE
jgi:hypothetical protein